MKEKIITLDGNSLTIDDIYDIAHGAKVQLPQDNAFYDMINKARKFLLDYIASGVPTYGVTTDFGDSCANQISVEKAGELQRVIVRYHGIGLGASFSHEEGRAIIACRLNSNTKGGFSAVRIGLLEKMVELLNHDIVPVIPQLGSVGASGDLTPLSYLAAVIMGGRDVYYKGAICKASDAMEKEGVAPLLLEAKEGLALMNGTSVMTAIAAIEVSKCRRLANISDYLTAITCEVLRGKDTPFCKTTNVIKNHKGQIDSAQYIYDIISTSKRVYKYEDFLQQCIKKISGDSFIKQENKIQDRYSIRCAPQVTGVMRDTLTFMAQLVTEEINSANDNPLVDIEGGRLLNTGNFYGGHICAACDYMRVAVANISDLSDKQAELIIDGKFNGLTDNLIPYIAPSDPTSGLHLGFKGAQITLSAIRGEVMSKSNPISITSSPTEALNQDKVSMGTISARSLRDQTNLLFLQYATHITAAMQALDICTMTKSDPCTLQDFSPFTQNVYKEIRKICAFMDADRELDADVTKVAQWLKETPLFL